MSLRTTTALRLLAPALLAAGGLVPLTSGVASAATPVCMSGNLQFDYQSAEAGTAKPTLTRAARNASVELWGREKSTDTDHKLNTGTQLTGANDGSFNLCYTPVNTAAMDHLYVRFTTQNNQVWRVVQDANNTPYSFNTPTLSNVSTNIALGTVKPSAATNRAWHAFDTVNLLWAKRANTTTPCWTTAEANAATCTTLNVNWTSGSGSGPWYITGTHTIFLSDSDPDSEHTTLHEAGHFFQHRLYKDWWPNVANCGAHTIPQAYSDTCSWTEAFADSVAAYVLGDQRYVWSTGWDQPFVPSTGWQTGDRVQGNIDGALLQLWTQVDGNWNGTIASMAAATTSTFSDWFKNVRPANGLSTTGAALTALDSHLINYGPTVAGDNAYHSLSNGGGVALQRGGTCSSGIPSVAVFAEPDTTRASQRWYFAAVGDGTFRIKDSCGADTSPLSLTAPATSGGQVTLELYTGAANQRWSVTKNAASTYTLVNPATGFALDGNAVAGNPVTAVTANSNTQSQNWASFYTAP
ncbi:RICIN domain-containing protein [Kitasatospora sp. NPDC004531]